MPQDKGYTYEELLKMGALPAPDNAAAIEAIKAAQAAKYPTREKYGVESGENMTGMQTAWDQTKATIVGGLQLPGNLFGTAKEAVASSIEGMLGDSTREENFMKGAFQSTVAPFKTLGRNAAALSGAYGFEPEYVSSTATPNGRIVNREQFKAPTTEENRGMAEASGANAMGVAIPAITKAAPVTNAASAVRNALKTDPIVDYVRALKPGKNMPDFSTRTAPTALDELKAYEDSFGVKVKTAEQAREAFKARSKVYNDVADKILEPRVDVMVPGSGAKIAQAKIEAIPDSVRLLDPEKYKSLVQSARQSAGDDFTIGQLNNIRKGQNAKAAASYGKNVKAMVIADENIAAMERAAADTSRELLYASTNQASPMAGSAFKEANRRIGAIIENQDLIEGKINSSIAQNRSLPKKAIETLGKIASPGTSLKEWARGESMTINENLASAVKRWQGRPVKIPTYFGGVEKRAGQFSVPSGVAPNLRDAPPLRQPVPPQFSVPSGSGGGPLPDVPVQPPPVDYLRGR